MLDVVFATLFFPVWNLGVQGRGLGGGGWKKELSWRPGEGRVRDICMYIMSLITVKPKRLSIFIIVTHSRYILWISEVLIEEGSDNEVEGLYV